MLSVYGPLVISGILQIIGAHCVVQFPERGPAEIQIDDSLWDRYHETCCRCPECWPER